MRLLLFNPETEYALASGAYFYTPPASVEQLRIENQLLPENWAEHDDVILVDDPAMLSSRFRLVSWNELGILFNEYPQIEIDPWGWNPALIRRLIDCGVPADRVPDHDRISLISSLAHRRTTIYLNSSWNKKVDEALTVSVPAELTSIEECMDYYRNNPGCWMKAPWSSSGRGVINTAADMSEILVEQWCRGILRRQGSVMGEIGATRMADFATEWKMCAGEACYLGLSSFTTSNRGKYISNESLSQQEMIAHFNSLSSIAIDEVINIQKEILQEKLNGYEGPLGVDMLIEIDGHLLPFIEVNLRHTMGMVALKGPKA